MKITKSYEEYCDLFKEISEKLGRPLKADELNRKNEYSGVLPNYKWFIEHCPDKSVKGYNDLLVYLGFKPRYDIPKEYAIQAIKKKYKELGRPLMYDDFRNPNGIDEIGIAVILNHWGTFNAMLTELGLPINQENMMEKQRSIDELKDDIIRLCNHIKETEGRITINQRKDIEDCEWCLGIVAYNRYFKEHLEMTLGEFIESIGFVPIKSGRGMVNTFFDGEVTTSQFEYIVSSYLRERNIPYSREKKYRDFIDGYKGYKTCDYVIYTPNNGVWYVEVAGVLDYRKMKKETPIRQRYRKNLFEKIRMLSENNLNYLIIYPHETDKEWLDAMFSYITGIPLEKLKSLAHHESVATTETYLAKREDEDIADILGIDSELLKEA